MQERKFEDLHPETTLEWLIFYLLKEVSLLRKDMTKKGK